MSVKIYFSGIEVTPSEKLQTQGPLILASNHPNSFLDAVLLGAMFKNPVHYVVRGDVFKKPLVRRIFTRLKMIPIYRLSEGRENLSLNDETFERCKKILSDRGIVLIFSEGLCVHEWKLRPLKKGTARLYLQSRFENKNGESAGVLPVGLNYKDFYGAGKHVNIRFGEVINAQNFICSENAPAMVTQFNKKLEPELQKQVLSQQETERASQKAKPVKALYIIPGIVGIFLLFPLYGFSCRLAKKLNRGGVFYDSMLFGFLMVLAPLYSLMLTSIIYTITGSGFAWWFLAVLPLLASAATKIMPSRNQKTVI